MMRIEIINGWATQLKAGFLYLQASFILMHWCHSDYTIIMHHHLKSLQDLLCILLWNMQEMTYSINCIMLGKTYNARGEEAASVTNVWKRRDWHRVKCWNIQLLWGMVELENWCRRLACLDSDRRTELCCWTCIRLVERWWLCILNRITYNSSSSVHCWGSKTVVIEHPRCMTPVD